MYADAALALFPRRLAGYNPYGSLNTIRKQREPPDPLPGPG